jgi:hypothetical protein
LWLSRTYDGRIHDKKIADEQVVSFPAGNSAEGGAMFTLLLPTADNAYTAEEKEAGREDQNEAFPLQTTQQLGKMKSEHSNREKIRNILSSKTKTDKLMKKILSPHDNTFMTELYGLMEAELSNTELNSCSLKI